MKKIMVVDDQDDFLIIMNKILSMDSDKYQIISINSSEKCLNYLKDNTQPDLILLDLMLPYMDGFELYDRIKKNKNWKDIPIIFITAWAKMKKILLERNLGEEFIEKPFDTKYLLDRIDSILEKN